MRTRNRENNWSSLGIQRRICWGSDVSAEIWMVAIHIYVKTGLHKMKGKSNNPATFGIFILKQPF